MNANNLKYLSDQVKYTGFGSSLEFEIRENVAKNQPEFQLKHKPEFGNGQAEATLHFRQSEQGNYFFNKYDLEVNKENQPSLTQTFNLYSPKEATVRDENNNPKLDTEGKEMKERVNSNFTLKEAYNMMDVNTNGEGRAVLKDFVNKEGEKYQAWNKLDFGNTDRYGNYEIKKIPAFDLEAKLSEFKGLEYILSNPDSKKQLLESLQKGNAQVVTMANADMEYKRTMTVKPEFKTIRLYDQNEQRLSNSKEKGHNVAEKGDTSKSEKQDQARSSGIEAKQNAEQDDGPAETMKKKPAKRKVHGVS
nr:hypothetical protein [Mucilaginibacter sp. L294]